jgi:hypothetical protein
LENPKLDMTPPRARITFSLAKEFIAWSIATYHQREREIFCQAYQKIEREREREILCVMRRKREDGLGVMYRRRWGPNEKV